MFARKYKKYKDKYESAKILGGNFFFNVNVFDEDGKIFKSDDTVFEFTDGNYFEHKGKFLVSCKNNGKYIMRLSKNRKPLTRGFWRPCLLGHGFTSFFCDMNNNYYDGILSQKNNGVYMVQELEKFYYAIKREVINPYHVQSFVNFIGLVEKKLSDFHLYPYKDIYKALEEQKEKWKNAAKKTGDALRKLNVYVTCPDKIKNSIMDFLLNDNIIFEHGSINIDETKKSHAIIIFGYNARPNDSYDDEKKNILKNSFKVRFYVKLQGAEPQTNTATVDELFNGGVFYGVYGEDDKLKGDNNTNAENIAEIINRIINYVDKK